MCLQQQRQQQRQQTTAVCCVWATTDSGCCGNTVDRWVTVCRLSTSTTMFNCARRWLSSCGATTTTSTCTVEQGIEVQQQDQQQRGRDQQQQRATCFESNNCNGGTDGGCATTPTTGYVLAVVAVQQQLGMDGSNEQLFEQQRQQQATGRDTTYWQQQQRQLAEAVDVNCDNMQQQRSTAGFVEYVEVPQLQFIDSMVGFHSCFTDNKGLHKCNTVQMNNGDSPGAVLGLVGTTHNVVVQRQARMVNRQFSLEVHAGAVHNNGFGQRLVAVKVFLVFFHAFFAQQLTGCHTELSAQFSHSWEHTTMMKSFSSSRAGGWR